MKKHWKVLSVSGTFAMGTIAAAAAGTGPALGIAAGAAAGAALVTIAGYYKKITEGRDIDAETAEASEKVKNLNKEFQSDRGINNDNTTV